MKIAVNTRLLIPGKMDGIAWFTFETLSRIVKAHPEHHFIFIFDRKPDERYRFAPNVEFAIAHPQARHPVLWYLFFEFGIPLVLKKHKPDLFLSPDGWLSLRAKTKSLTVIHDLNFEEHPEFIPSVVRKYYHYFFPRFAKRANRIATVSEYTRADIVKRYGVEEEKIDVVYNGANASYKPVDESTVKITRDKYTAGAPYFVFVGTIHPRKNLSNLFLAFDTFKKRKESNIKLLIVGDKKWWTEDIRKSYESLEHKKDVVFAGRLSTKELHHAVASALAMTYVSFFEGFGIPIVEAYYCGVPVITSNVTSMPEVAGDAALLVDPFSVESICDAMMKIAWDRTLRSTLIQKGKIRGKEFNWEKSAEKLWESMIKTVDQRSV
jgi:glycosyltransferase involved in cell wall biosynthesis